MGKRSAPDLVIPPELRELVDHARAIDRVIHEPARLFILALLVGSEEISIREMQTKSGLTSGNMSAQIAKLEKAGYVEVLKAFQGRRPTTSYQLTSAGQAAWKTYWDHMNALLGGLEDIGELKQPHWPGDRWVAKDTTT